MKEVRTYFGFYLLKRDSNFLPVKKLRCFIWKEKLIKCSWYQKYTHKTNTLV